MKTGRKAYAPTTEQRQHVLSETGCGATQKQLAGAMGITMKTLRKHFAKELKDGRSWANKMVAKSLFWQATVGKNTTAAIWWEKTRSGMHEKLALEHTANALPPPELGISFEDGGPGRVRKTPYKMENDSDANAPLGADRLGNEEHAVPRQEFIPAKQLPAPTPSNTSSIWEKLAEPADFKALEQEDWGARYAAHRRAGLPWKG